MFANQYVENDALAADIVQECFVKLWQLRDDFMYVHQIKSFLYTSVRNKSCLLYTSRFAKYGYAR